MDNSKLDKILDSLDAMRAELKDFKAEIKEEVNSAHKKINDLQDKQESESGRLTRAFQEITQIREDSDKVWLASKVYSYKYNLIFTGIEGDERDKRETERILRCFWGEKLGIDYQDIYLADVHRLGPMTNDRPRNIIAKFIQLSDRDFIMNNAKNLRPYRITKKLTNGSTVSHQQYTIQEHLPPELVDEKKGLMPMYRQAASMGLKTKFKVIGIKMTLLINGQKYDPNKHVITSKGLKLKPIQPPKPPPGWEPNVTNIHVRFDSTDSAQSFATSTPVMPNKTETVNVPEQDDTIIMSEEASSNLSSRHSPSIL